MNIKDCAQVWTVEISISSVRINGHLIDAEDQIPLDTQVHRSIQGGVLQKDCHGLLALDMDLLETD